MFSLGHSNLAILNKDFSKKAQAKQMTKEERNKNQLENYMASITELESEKKYIMTMEQVDKTAEIIIYHQ